MEKSFIFSLIFAALVAIFALANGNKVAIDLLFTKIQISQAIVIFISTILGAVIMALLGMVRTFKLKREIKELNKEINPLEGELSNLKSLLENRGEEIKNLNERIEEMEKDRENLQMLLDERNVELESINREVDA